MASTTTTDSDGFDFDGFRKLAKENDGWKFVTEEHGVQVFSRVFEGSPLAVSKGIASIKATFSDVRALAIDPGRRCQWDHLLTEFRVIRAIADENMLIYMKSISSWPVSSRDFVVQVKALDYPTGETVVLARPVIDEEKEMPRQKGCVRGKVVNSGFLIERKPDDAAQVVIYYAIQLDLGGWIPTAMVNSTMSDEPLGLIGFRKVLTGSVDP